MKYIITIFVSFSILISCQKNVELREVDNQKNQNSNEYLKIPIDNNTLLIGPLNSINNDLQKDYTIKKINDTIFIFKNFLESSDIDGAQIKFENNIVDKQVKIYYQIAYLFNGTEKANDFIDISYLLSTELKPKNEITPFVEITKNKELISFLKLNKNNIQRIAYNHFINYYKNFSAEELKSCCPSDYTNFNKLKNISQEEIQLLDVDKDLGAYLDYKSLIIEIPSNSSKKSVIVFSKKDNVQEDLQIEKFEKKAINSVQDKNDEIIRGSFQINGKAISLYDKKESDLSYFIYVNSNNSATVSIGAEHSEDYWCEGEYDLINENGILHARGKCDENDLHDFYIKKENNQFYIKSKRFVNKDWQVLTKD